MLHTTTCMKERFCKEAGIPLKIYHSPVFDERLKLFDKYYGISHAAKVFQESVVNQFGDLGYPTEFNRIKDVVIKEIMNHPDFLRFQEEVFGCQYYNVYSDISRSDIFKPHNHGKTFLSIDMKHASFQSLRKFSPDIFGGAKIWEEFISNFTSIQHIIESRFFRQLIFGNCNPNAQRFWIRFLTYQAYSNLWKSLMGDPSIRLYKNQIIYLSAYEFIFDVTSMSNEEINAIITHMNHVSFEQEISYKAEIFDLYRIDGVQGCYKKIYNIGKDSTIEFKGVHCNLLPMVIRRFEGKEIEDSDLYCMNDNILCKYVDVPTITFPEREEK